ncbi:hypothetical protein PAMP_023809 [Pampus punctatissimus]
MTSHVAQCENVSQRTPRSSGGQKSLCSCVRVSDNCVAYRHATVPVFLEAPIAGLKLGHSPLTRYQHCTPPHDITHWFSRITSTLWRSSRVDGAIHRAAGPMLKKECASLHGCETGEAKITCGYKLPAKYVIHTVGPIAQGGVGEKEKKALRSCYKNSLQAATANAARSVQQTVTTLFVIFTLQAFPCISTGIYGYPPEQAVHEAIATVREYLDEHHDK